MNKKGKKRTKVQIERHRSIEVQLEKRKGEKANYP